MTITVDTLLAGMLQPNPLSKASFTGEAAGILHSQFAIAGLPGTGVIGTPGTVGVALTGPLAGCFQYSNPGAPTQTYLAGLSFACAANVTGVRVIDRLWYNSGISVTTTTLQSFTSVAFPARDANGLTLGAGVQIGIEVSTATTNVGAIANTTLSYTNSLGAGTRTATIPSFPATAVAGTFVPFILQGNDQGVRQIDGITLGTSYGGGAISLVAYRTLYSGGEAIGTGVLSHTAGFTVTRLPRVFDSSCLHTLVLLSGTAAGVSYGELSLSQASP